MLLDYLADRCIPLEVCPTSNLRLGVYPTYGLHPLPRLLQAGAVVTVNSDDPPLFNTTLTDELLLLGEHFDLSANAIDRLVLNAVRASFLPTDEMQAMEAAFVEEMGHLKSVHLPG